MKTIEDLNEMIVELEEVFLDGLIVEPCLAYVSMLDAGFGGQQVIRDILYDYSELLEDYEHHGHYAIIAFAVFLYDLGRLPNNIKDKALKVLEKEIKDYEQDTNPLLSLKQLCDYRIKLEKDQPPRLKLKKKKYQKCEWAAGDVFLYHVTEEKKPKHNPRRYIYPTDDLLKKYDLMNKYVLILKMGDFSYGETDKSSTQVLTFLNWVGDEPLTDLEEISKLEPVPLSGYSSEFKLVLQRGKLELIETPIVNKHPRGIYPKNYPYEMFSVDAVDQERLKVADFVYVGNIERLSNFEITRYTNGISTGDIHEINFKLNEALRRYSDTVVKEKLFIEPNRIVSWL